MSRPGQVFREQGARASAVLRALGYTDAQVAVMIGALNSESHPRDTSYLASVPPDKKCYRVTVEFVEWYLAFQDGSAEGEKTYATREQAEARLREVGDRSTCVMSRLRRLSSVVKEE